MLMKRKGCRTERELIDILWANNYAAIRVAGSGVSKYYCPDIVASNGSNVFAIECKSTKNGLKYIDSKQWTELVKFSEIFGAIPLIALRKNKHGWYFFTIKDLEKTKNQSLKIDQDAIDNRSKIIYDLKKL